jgi:hypothetical protein
MPQTSVDPKKFGQAAKHFIDTMRLKFLEGFSFEAQHAEYVDDSVSLENRCIVAKKNWSS